MHLYAALYILFPQKVLISETFGRFIHRVSKILDPVTFRHNFMQTTLVSVKLDILGIEN